MRMATWTKATLHSAGLDNLRMCRADQERSERTIVFDGVKCERRTIRIPAVARCRCGARLELASSWLNTCDNCGRDYDGSGAALAPRQHWGEETGEHWADTVLV